MRTTALVLAGLLVAAGAGRAEEKLTPEERALLQEEVGSLIRRCDQFYAAGRLTEAADLAAKALDKSRRLYPRDRFPDGHRLLATRINNLAHLLQACGEYAKAEPLYREALDM